MAKYQSVNGQWPAGTNDGRDLKPTPDEAIAGARKLWRKFTGKTLPAKLTSGGRRTSIRRGVLYVNPDQDTWQGRGGWHEIVHHLSHWASFKLHPKAKGHGPQHAFIEREMIKHVVESGWLEGALVKAKPAQAPVDAKAVRAARVAERIKRWEAKQRRAETALKKLRRSARRYEAQGVSP